MTAEKLRQAAAEIRAKAEAATPGPWVGTVYGVRTGDRRIDVAAWDEHTGTPNMRNRVYIAAMHPGVALAVADWLDRVADHSGRFAGVMQDDALAVADAILGGIDK
jgi:hypothetical protein